MLEQNNFDSIMDRLSTAIIVVNAQLTIIYVNAAAEIMLSISGEQMCGRTIDHCFIESGDICANLRQALSSNQHFTKRKACWMLHHHQEITVDYSVSPNFDAEQVVLEVQPMDRLLRISKEEAWISSQETSRNLVRSLAHEIKNPLGGIRGAAQLLSRELCNDENLDEYTRIIIDETDRLRHLVDRMLGPRVPAQFGTINIHEVLEHVLSIIKLEANDQLAITKDYDPSIPDLLGDKDLLVQALLNIVRNAMQALTESNTPDAKVVIRSRVQRRYTIGRTHHPLVVQLSIRDNGPGIPADLIEDIFFPMITGRANGSGLGLAISQNLISQHRGLIECASEPGNTSFDIYLPLGNTHE